jgi:hypothetical protein
LVNIELIAGLAADRVEELTILSLDGASDLSLLLNLSLLLLPNLQVFGFLDFNLSLVLFLKLALILNDHFVPSSLSNIKSSCRILIDNLLVAEAVDNTTLIGTSPNN